ncbi:MAG: type I-B CRISPR-associated protein Cas8b1/Cst1 [Candidatus Caldarchaeum sp.]
MSEIVLYPSNWLYNAGVIGLLRVLEEPGEQVEKFIADDGSAHIAITKDADQIFKQWTDLSPRSKKGTSLVYGWKDAYYANQTESSIRKRINVLVSGDREEEKVKESAPVFSCAFCTARKKIKKTNATFLNQAFGKILLGSEKSFSNMYWNNSARDFVCPKCEFILMCHHLALTRLSDDSEIFINAPSFKVMYYLNRFAQEAFGVSSSAEARTKREILAMSVIEYATKIQATLGVWTGMNIEIVSRRGSEIEFFSLPHEVIQLLADRRIASLLSQIGEFSILNNVLNQDFSRLMELGYRLLRIGVKPYGERGKPEISFVNENLRLDKNRQNPQRVAEQIFQLCAFIEEKRKRREIYEYIGTT